MPAAKRVEHAAERLLAASRPAILLGPQGSDAVPLVLELADLLGAPVATTPDALSLVDGRRSCGVYSFGASAHARRTLERADLILAVSDLGEFTCRLRLRRAQRELERGRSLSMIAAELGYRDEAYLCRVFKAHYGITPGAWRTVFRSNDRTGRRGQPRADVAPQIAGLQ